MTDTIQTTATRVDPLDTAENEIALYREALPSSPDDVLLTRGRLAEVKRRVTELLSIIDEHVMVPLVKQCGGEIVIAPGVKWVMKLDKTVKCRSNRATIEAIYAKTEGNFDRMVDCLSVNALKPGETRKVLGDDFDAHFETTVKEDVELKQPKKVLALVNENFVK